MEYHCGKLCKVDCGLRPHQRFWQISDVPKLRELFNKNVFKKSFVEYDNNIKSCFWPPKLNWKADIKLLKAKQEQQSK